MPGHYRPASETPFGWRFACGPIVARFYVLSPGIRRLITKTRTAQEILDEQPRFICDPVYPSIRCSHTQSRYEDAILTQIQAYFH